MLFFVDQEIASLSFVWWKGEAFGFIWPHTFLSEHM